ncbi:MAG: lytic transglycosylase domain-containing protein [Proteobacteria bacterium]|nr:lytic transglycosylase domain-containing protein [Pseudomonadota bacterium]
MTVFVRDVGCGMLEVSHNTLALFGLVVVSALLFGAGRADLREEVETLAFNWLESRHEAREEPVVPTLAEQLSEPDAVARATASDPKDLNRQQALVAQWLARRYHVAPEPVSRLVKEAWDVGARAGLDPTLILAIMAVESSFNPFAQSAVGAQGLMQVMTKVHDDKYEAYGGNHAAFDPVTNLRVGVQVLKECIRRAGSLEAGLRYYVGAGNQSEDSGYAGRVLSEQSTLRLVASGKNVPIRSTPPVTNQAVQAPAEPATPAKDAEAHPTTPERVALLQR